MSPCFLGLLVSCSPCLRVTAMHIEAESNGKGDYILGFGGDHGIPSRTHAGVGAERF